MVTISSPLATQRRRRRRASVRRTIASALKLAGWAVALLLNWQARARERRILQQLDDRALRDVGLSRADVEREIGKPFWHL